LYQTEHKLCDVITKTNKAKESLNFLLLQVENQQANIKSHLNKFEDFQEKTNIKLKHDLYYQKSLSVVKKHKRFLKKQENSIHEIKDNFMKKLNKLSEIHKREKLIYRAKECTGELEGLIN